MEQCLIEGCPNEAKIIAKSGGRKYCACEKHRKDVTQIIASEFSRGEKERIISAFPKEEKEIPKWMRL